ncbi:hypothetical protein QYE76_060506 [Lolium multiflorum]|uniref:J domain-containing protein n=1 Tax=Lolium multiflorum TaxID=4521 RepID=A0AAD8S075_LOLMU|nr:hypothetical protein QYE76_060506 [Lolium multiflorum]
MADAATGKAQAVREVCAASAAFASCPHRRRSPRRPPFVDWYLVLAVRSHARTHLWPLLSFGGAHARTHLLLLPPLTASVFRQIDEAASEDAIKRRYRHLALQLHPDKNRHPKAEIAFKLVAEAHACLTDKARRRAFDADRSTAFCAECHARLATTRHRAKKSTPSSAPSARHGPVAAKPRGTSGRRPHVPAATQALREVQNRLRDECRIIDECLRANGDIARRRQSFPLFDPSDQNRFPDYPHARPPPMTPFPGCRPFEEDFGVAQEQTWSCRGASGGDSFSESPVYQARTAPERASRKRRPWCQ